MTRAETLERLAGLIGAVRRAHPVRVAIDGISAAGKTTLADELVGAVERLGRPVIRASVDDFHRPAKERYRRGRYSAESYYEDAFDYPAVRERLLQPLGPGGSRRYRAAVFDAFHERPSAEPDRLAPDDAVVLVDGVFLFRPELNDLWDCRIFLDVDFEESLRRGMERDRAWMGSEDEARERYLTRYQPGEQLYLEAVQPLGQADVVVDNREPDRPRLTLTHGALAILPSTCKAFAYVTHEHPQHGTRLLVFSHPNEPSAGIQVPAGTVEPGEAPEAAVLREAHEETGLDALEMVGFLGEQVHDRWTYGRNEIHHRSFFHLRCTEKPSEVWRHVELDPSEGDELPLFELFWVPLPHGVPEMVAEHEIMLPALLVRLAADT